MAAKQDWKPPTVRTLWGLAKSPELGLDSDTLHMVVQAQTGKGSIRELTSAEIARVAALLMQMKDSARGGRRPRVPAGGSTANQRRKVYKLMEELGWNEKRVNGMCRRMFGVLAVEWLDYTQVSKLIEALKAMAAREKEDQDGGLQADADGQEREGRDGSGTPITGGDD